MMAQYMMVALRLRLRRQRRRRRLLVRRLLVRRCVDARRCQVVPVVVRCLSLVQQRFGPRLR